MKQILHFHMIPCYCSFVNNFFFHLITFIAFSAKYSQCFLIESLSLYMSMLILKNDTVDTENPHRICLVIFAVHELLGLF